MLTAIILLSFIAAAFWKEAIKLAIAAVLVILLLGLIQLAQIVDEAGLVPSGTGEITQPR